MQNLLKNSDEAAQKTDEIVAIGKDVTSVLAETVETVNTLIEGVNETG